MIRKNLNWISIGLGSLIGLLVLVFIVPYVIGSVKWNKLHGSYDVLVQSRDNAPLSKPLQPADG